MSIVTHYRLQIQTGWKIETLRPTERLAYEKNEPRTYGGIARNLTVEDSFTNGEFDIEIMITSDEGPYKQAKFRVTVDTIIIFIGRSISNRLLELLIHDKNCWDAQTYDEVSRLVQYRWGQQVLEWRKWGGDEIVMDAGCGSGLLTKLLAKKVPKGKVYAVDMDSNMIRQAKRNLKDLENVELVQSDFAHVKLTTKLDVVFSNAALHWAHDHAQVFQHFWKMLNCDKTRTRQLLIQCGGYGNLRRILTLLRRVMKLNEFKVYFANMNQSWYFAKHDDTSKLLGEIGYVSTKVHLHNDCVNLADREIYSRFVKTVIMKPFLEHLPDDKTRNRYLELFLDEVEKRSIGNKKSQTPWSLDFVRLNIIADKPWN